MPAVWDGASFLGWGLPVCADASYLDWIILSFSLRFLSFLKLSLKLLRYRSNRFGYRIILIEAADLDKDYRNIVIEFGIKLSSAHQ